MLCSDPGRLLDAYRDARNIVKLTVHRPLFRLHTLTVMDTILRVKLALYSVSSQDSFLPPTAHFSGRTSQSPRTLGTTKPILWPGLLESTSTATLTLQFTSIPLIWSIPLALPMQTAALFAHKISLVLQSLSSSATTVFVLEFWVSLNFACKGAPVSQTRWR